MNNEKKLLRQTISRLTQPGTFLKQITKEDWGVFSNAEPDAKPSLKLNTQHIVAMRSSDLIRLERDGRARLTDAGRTWHTRQESQGDPFLAQHQDRCIEHFRDADGRLETVTVNKAESPLYWLRSRKDKSGKPLLTNPQFQAGERLRRDFTLAQLQPRTTASWSIAGGDASRRRRHGARANSGATATERAMAARDRFNDALSAVGPELADPLIEVCCFLRGVEETEGKLGWPKRSGKLVLRLALSALARHYNESAPGTTRAPALSGTLDIGYRPVMFPDG